MSDESVTYTVVPGQIRALSDEGKAWFTATRRNAGAYAKKVRVPQDLAEGKRAVDAAKADDHVFPTRPSRYDAHVDAFQAIEAEIYWSGVWERVKDGYVRPYHDDAEKAEKKASYLHEHLPSTAHRHASWFAFDDAGKVVLSLRVSRERALDIALGYNKAGGCQENKAPEPVLDDADLADCIAIPEERPTPEPVTVDPLAAFAGDDGILVRTPRGTMACERYSDGKAAVNRVLVDPARTGPDESTTAYKHHEDPLPEVVSDWLKELAEAPAVTVYAGPLSKLPRPGDVVFQKRSGKYLIFTPPGFSPVFADAKQVREVVKGSTLVRIEVVRFGDHGLVRVVRADGLVGLLSAWLGAVQYTTNEGRTVVLR